MWIFREDKGQNSNKLWIREAIIVCNNKQEAYKKILWTNIEEERYSPDDLCDSLEALKMDFIQQTTEVFNQLKNKN